ncbi:interferon-induced protein 44-like [Haliotis rufescens]|uniref:interferon-induced protein 44-like n=1 Tax=Haliotis rufescens TaxID=6454 RepID=UPI00201EE4B2|nr:interferon-induced protein 44-like [Haliotis rufescens]
MGIFGSKPDTHQWNRNTRISWDETGAAALLGEIKDMIRPFKERHHALNILVFGPTGCGKSSLLNGLRTSCQRKTTVATYFPVGTSQDVSFTRDFQCSTWEDCVTLFDMAGVFESPKIKSEDILNIVQGKVPFTGEINDFLEPKTLESAENRKHISCVVLVLKPGMELPVNLKRICSVVRSSAGKGEIACHLVITHLDEVDDCFKTPRNLNRVFDEMPKIQNSVKQMSSEIGIPPYSISFVRNYSHESQSDVMSTVLFLHTFKQILNAACEQEEKRTERAANAE